MCDVTSTNPSDMAESTNTKRFIDYVIMKSTDPTCDPFNSQQSRENN